MKPWKRIEPTTVTKVGWRTIVSKTFIDNRGNQHVFDIIGREGDETAHIIALTPDKQVIIARQYRTGPEKVMEELPGGMLSPGEEKTETASRELLEETGYEAGHMEYMGYSYLSNYAHTITHTFLATDCRLVREQELEHEEEVEVDTISISQLLDNAKHGKMTDAVGVLLAYDQLMKLQENVS